MSQHAFVDEAQRCTGLQIVFSRKKGTCLFGTHPSKNTPVTIQQPHKSKDTRQQRQLYSQICLSWYASHVCAFMLNWSHSSPTFGDLRFAQGFILHTVYFLTEKVWSICSSLCGHSSLHGLTWSNLWTKQVPTPSLCPFLLPLPDEFRLCLFLAPLPASFAVPQCAVCAVCPPLNTPVFPFVSFLKPSIWERHTFFSASPLRIVNIYCVRERRTKCVCVCAHLLNAFTAGHLSTWVCVTSLSLWCWPDFLHSSVIKLWQFADLFLCLISPTPFP